MAAGVPVVATKVGGNSEVVEDRVTGFLVPPQDSAALARATGLVLENKDLAASFGQAGRRRVADMFSVERSIRETQSLYQRLVESNGQY
jgi:glycosyltransferase involved in cell wall biosynthesis